MPNYDFLCASGHTFERIVDATLHYVICPKCGTPATRLPAAPVGMVKNGTPKFYK